ncbi:hypothetical protein ACGFWI_01160 [Streptomyces sp. NPDC048434]|uniref:hypothetical protein n=1 Tax=Streptomyces sp. NPDC048434 TaxID=3365549 RepID=UPI00371A2E6A
MRDENRIRRLARRIRPAKTAEPQPPTVEITVTPAEEPGEDWLDRLIFNQGDAETADDSDQTPEEPGARWYSLGKQQAPAAPDVHHPAPGVQVNINPPPVPSPEDVRAGHRRSRRQLWIAYHGSAAAVGWYVGLGPQMAHLLNSSGNAAPAVGIGLIICTGWPLAYLKPSHLPESLRPVATWASRIPPATAVLVLALHSAHPLI